MTAFVSITTRAALPPSWVAVATRAYHAHAAATTSRGDVHPPTLVEVAQLGEMNGDSHATTSGRRLQDLPYAYDSDTNDGHEHATDRRVTAMRRMSLRGATLSGSAALFTEAHHHQHGPRARCRVQCLDFQEGVQGLRRQCQCHTGCPCQ